MKNFNFEFEEICFYFSIIIMIISYMAGLEILSYVFLIKAIWELVFIAINFINKK